MDKFNEKDINEMEKIVNEYRNKNSQKEPVSYDCQVVMRMMDRVRDVLLNRNATRNQYDADIHDYATVVNGVPTFFPVILMKYKRIESLFGGFPTSVHHNEIQRASYIDDLQDLVNYCLFELMLRERDHAPMTLKEDQAYEANPIGRDRR